MIFPLLETEPIVQVNDKTRISASKTFISDEAPITLVEVEPEVGAGFIDISGSLPLYSKNWNLDWAYATAGTKAITLRVTTDGAPVVFTKQVVVLTEADDALWSTDEDLMIHEPDILKWVKSGRATYKDYHRMAQTRILEWLDNLKIWNKDGKAFTKADITPAIAKEDLKRISTYWVLELIFAGISNKTDDVFFQKQKAYGGMRKDLQGERSRIRADWNQDGDVDDFEEFRIKSMVLHR
jgi:hypothetical protein